MRTRHPQLLALWLTACAGDPAPTVLVQADGERVSGFGRDQGGLFWTTYGDPYARLWWRGDERSTAGGDQQLAWVVGTFGPPVALNGRVYWVLGGVGPYGPYGGEGLLGTAPGEEPSHVYDDDSLSATIIGGVRISAINADGLGLYGLGLFNDGELHVRIYHVPLDGGAPSLLTEQTAYVGSFAPCAEFLCWTSSQDVSAIVRMPLGGGAIEEIATGQAYPVALVADSSHVYWSNHGNSESQPVGSLMRLALSGGAPETLAAGLVDPGNIALDGDFVYVALSQRTGLGSIVRVPKSGGAPRTLVDNLDEPVQLQVDGDWLYFANAGEYYGGSIMKVRKDTEIVSGPGPEGRR